MGGELSADCKAGSHKATSNVVAVRVLVSVCLSVSASFPYFRYGSFSTNAQDLQ